MSRADWPSEDVVVGRKALKLGLVNHEQLVDCLLALRDARGIAFPLSDLLVGRGYVRPEEVGRLLLRDADRAFGRLAVEIGRVDPRAVAEGLRALRSTKTQRRLRDLLVEQGHLTRPQVQQLEAQGARKSDFHCPACGTRFSLTDEDAARTPCVRCGQPLEPVEAAGGDLPAADLAAAVYVKQKDLVPGDDLRSAMAFGEGLRRYGVDMSLPNLLRRLKLVTGASDRRLRALDFRRVVRTKAWMGQGVPGYRITGKIAVGGEAGIFSAETFFTRERVAIKILRKELSDNKVAVGRFQQEARLMMRFDHPNIVKALESGEFRKVRYIAMEQVQGTRMDWAVLSQKRFSPYVTVKLARQVAEGLRYMESQGFLHRDVKPQNILLDRRDRVRICDLGFAAEIHWRPGETSDTGIETAAYASPEQAQGERNLTAATDIYSLGLTLFFMLTGRHAFDAETPEKIMTLRFKGGTAAPDLEAVDAPQALVTLIGLMIDPEPGRRLSEYGGILAALDRIEL